VCSSDLLDGWAVGFGDYAKEESSANRRKVGIWNSTFARPQEWRRNKKNEYQEVPIGDWIDRIIGRGN